MEEFDVAELDTSYIDIQNDYRLKNKESMKEQCGDEIYKKYQVSVFYCKTIIAVLNSGRYFQNFEVGKNFYACGGIFKIL
jgi:hypothetical protein